jgi:hypothetical protein
VTIACAVGIAALCIVFLWLDNMNRHGSPGRGRKELGGQQSLVEDINANTNEFIREMREKEASEPSDGFRRQNAENKTERDTEE